MHWGWPQGTWKLESWVRLRARRGDTLHPINRMCRPAHMLCLCLPDIQMHLCMARSLSFGHASRNQNSWIQIDENKSVLVPDRGKQ